MTRQTFYSAPILILSVLNFSYAQTPMPNPDSCVYLTTYADNEGQTLYQKGPYGIVPYPGVAILSPTATSSYQGKAGVACSAIYRDFAAATSSYGICQGDDTTDRIACRGQAPVSAVCLAKGPVGGRQAACPSANDCMSEYTKKIYGLTITQDAAGNTVILAKDSKEGICAMPSGLCGTINGACPKNPQDCTNDNCFHAVMDKASDSSNGGGGQNGGPPDGSVK